MDASSSSKQMFSSSHTWRHARCTLGVMPGVHLASCQVYTWRHARLLLQFEGLGGETGLVVNIDVLGQHLANHSEFVFYTCMWSNAVQNAVGYVGDSENNGDSNDDISDTVRIILLTTAPFATNTPCSFDPIP